MKHIHTQSWSWYVLDVRDTFVETNQDTAAECDPNEAIVSSLVNDSH